MADEAVPMFDDIPSFDDLPDAAAPSAAQAIPRFDDIPAFDDIPSGTAPEGALMSGVREAAHSVIPAAAGFVGMGAGAALGGAGGTLIAGPGPGTIGGAVVGGVGGMVAASMGAGKVQQEFLEAIGFDDTEQRRANAQANPKSAFAGQMAPALVAMSPVGVGGGLARQATVRGAGAGVSAGFEAGQEYLMEGEVDPTKVGMAAAAGAALPGLNRVGQRLSNAGASVIPKRFQTVPGRPGVVPDPEAAPAHADVGDPHAEIDVSGSALAQEAPPPAGSTTGNPQSAPVRSERIYGKGKAPDPSQDTLTEGVMDPATQAAILDAAPDEVKASRANSDKPKLSLKNVAPEVPSAPEPIPGFDDHPSGMGQPARTMSPVASDAGLLSASSAQREGLAKVKAKQAAMNGGDNFIEPTETTLDTERSARPVEPGFPKPGEPVAVGQNDATALPQGAAKAISRSKTAGREKKILDLKNLYLDAEQAGDQKHMTAIQKRLDAMGVKPAEPVTAAVTEVPARAPNAAPDALESAKPMPELKGETPINASVTEAQRAAGNYPKARGHDFGKPLKIETHADDMRRGKSPTGKDWEVKLPYDYGYFNKTKGRDKDHIDFARPKDGAPEAGNKHFIIDQLDAGRSFDEHKVFTYYKDADAARAHYEAGFSDGKGPQRLGSITEVSRGDLVKFLTKHTTRAANQPYDKARGNTKAGAKIGEPKVVARARELMHSQGLPEEAITRFNELPAAQRAAEATKYVNAVGSKTGQVKTATTTRIRPQAPEVPGAPGITARSKADATRKGEALAKMNSAMEKNPPGDAETPAALRARLQNIVDDAGDSIETYKPSVKPAAFQLVRQAKQMLLRKTWKPEHINAFTTTEKLLRSGEAGAADTRASNRIEADIARSRRSGDDAVASAEAQRATTNTVEDDLIASIDAKRGGKKFDVPHEEAEAMVEPTPVRSKADLKKLPRKTVDVADSALAKIDTKAIDTEVNAAAKQRRAEAAALAGKKSEAKVAESEGAASKPRSIDVVDKGEIERLNALMNKAADRGKTLASREALDNAPAPMLEKKGTGPRDLLGNFLSDEGGSVDFNKIKNDLNKALGTTHHTSYIAKTSKVLHSEYVRSLSDDLHKANQADNQHKLGLREQWKALPKEFNDPKVMERAYLLREQGKIASLTPEEKAHWDKHIQPVLDENDAFVKAIRAIDPDRMGPDVLNHIMRIAKNDGGPLFRNIHEPDDPTRPAIHAMGTNADTAKLRKFVALERVSDGKRFVISPRDNGFTLWDKYKASRIKDTAFEFEAGKGYKAGPVDYVMRDAFTPEIENNARGDDGKPMQYYKNAALSAYLANAQLGSMARHLAELHRITETPEWKRLTTRNIGKANEKGWIESKLPNFRGTFMDPHLRYVFDDYAKAGFDTPDFFRQLSQGVTKLLFWAPVAHLANVGVHWQVGRGWDWITPKGTRSLFVDGMKAMKSVVMQDDFQRQMREHGAGTIYGSVLNRKFVEQVFAGVKEDILRRPSDWRPIFKKLGLSDSVQDVVGTPIRWLDKYVYDNSAKIMWAGNDMFLTQRVMELQRKGKSMKDAITEAERDIPNYRIPTTLITEGKWGRFMQQAAADPSILSFGRYHYGVFNSFANILKDGLSASSTVGDRLDALGKLFAMGMMAFVAYPIWDKAIKFFTQNEEATAHRRGPVAVGSHIKASLDGKSDIMQAMRSTLTVPPLTSTVLEALANRDFRGKQVVEPGDVRSAARGDFKAAGRVLIQEGEHALKGLVSPYGTLSNADKKDVSAPGAVRDTLLDAKNPSKKGIKFERMVPIHRDRDARSRFKQGGSGPMEKIYNKATGYR